MEDDIERFWVWCRCRSRRLAEPDQLRDLSAVLVIAIGWMYVVLMLALSKSTLAAGVGVVVFYGVLPLGVILYIVGFPRRARTRNQHESVDVAGEHPHDPDRHDAEPH
jgi:predicted membrane channel-forming protein YqfA (hemolysin III family)